MRRLFLLCKRRVNTSRTLIGYWLRSLIKHFELLAVGHNSDANSQRTKFALIRVTAIVTGFPSANGLVG
jgi:hypothetical protein